MTDNPHLNSHQLIGDVLDGLEDGSLNDINVEVYGIYSWEQEVERSWDALIEQDGVLEYRQKLDDQFKRSYLESTSSKVQGKIRKGMIRNLLLLLDFSVSMRDMDFKPDRINCVLLNCEEFIREFFMQNPISHMGVIAMRNMTSELIQTLSASPEEQIHNIKLAKQQGLSGAPSLESGLILATRLLSSIPPYGTREILIFFGSLRTCDSGSIEAVLEKLKENNIRANVISLSPELYILKRICKETGGKFSVALHKDHFHDILMQYVNPPPWSEGMQPTLVRMGFPPKKRTTTAALCVCHQNLTYWGYICPQCGSKVCEIPTRCKCCMFHLVSPADISRTFHHLFPPSPFEPLPEPEPQIPHFTCCGCFSKFRKGAGKCPECQSVFCYDCDVYCHEQLHHCPLCVIKDCYIPGEKAGNKLEGLRNAEKA